jgi:hypothetical protein
VDLEDPWDTAADTADRQGGRVEEDRGEDREAVDNLYNHYMVDNMDDTTSLFFV